MHAVVVNVTIKDPEPAVGFLREQVVPQVAQAPGLVNAYWTRSDEGKGLSMIVFESEEAAKAMAERISSGPDGPPPDAVTLDSVEVREVVANL